ncbi:MAG: DGQHR domain-containing protein [Chloroflexi bacterium]|nr:DGQHR domain-containing protein [Chloroflexota bacterium]MBL7061252.1 DGQHR domain-containing protein [Dehalococcoidia bacterium]
MPKRDSVITVQGFELQNMPRIYVAAILGRWLLERTTPSWRIENPVEGFQRVVREVRAREIALAVLDQRRTFPNSIVLATDSASFSLDGPILSIPLNTKFLVVDGQHRLWAQNFSGYDAPYSCVIHMGLSEVEMARLFLEINDNQKRVPSSLRWDLVRLVRPDDDPEAIGAAEMVFMLATDEESPLYQRIDLTGEQPEIRLKQGSIAPAIRQLLTQRSPLRGLSFEQQYQVVMQYFIAIREFDRDGWRTGESAFYAARVLRALLRLLADIFDDLGRDNTTIAYRLFLPYLRKIDTTTLSSEALRAAQGEAGIRAIYRQMHEQVFA